MSRKEAREGCGQLGPSPLDTAPPSTTVAGQGRKPGARQMPEHEFDREEQRSLGYSQFLWATLWITFLDWAASD